MKIPKWQKLGKHKKAEAQCAYQMDLDKPDNKVFQSIPASQSLFFVTRRSRHCYVGRSSLIAADNMGSGSLFSL